MRRFWTTEEKKFLRNHAHLLTAQQIGEKLGRTTGAVNSKAEQLGISLSKRGENHWNARHTYLRVQMISTLMDAGYSAKQIKQAFKLDESEQSIYDSGTGRTWREGVKEW